MSFSSRPVPDKAPPGDPASSLSTPTLSEMFHRLWKGDTRTRAARSVEYFGWIDFVLGIIILVAPYWAAALLRVPPLSTQDANYLHLVGLLVAGLGFLYIVSGRLSAEGFVVASLLDRPLVPAIMAILWYRHILPGPMAVAFSISDFGGFLWTLSAWRADVRAGQNIGGPGLQGQTRAARSVEVFGWILAVFGSIILLAPYWVASLLHLPALPVDGPNYFRLAGLLVGGLGMLYVVGGSLNAQGFVFATLLDRPLVPVIMAVLWSRSLIPGTLALAFSVTDFSGFLCTLSAWRADARYGRDTGPRSIRREVGCRILRVHQRRSAERSYFSSRWKSVSRHSPLSGAGGRRSGARRRATLGQHPDAHRNGGHEEGDAALAGRPHS